MKIFKTLLIAFMLSATTQGVAQISDGPIKVDPNDPGNSTYLDIPKSSKSSERILDNSKLSQVVLYSKVLKGNITMTFDSQAKLVSVLVPKDSKVPRDLLLNSTTSKVPNCYGHDCVTDASSDVGAGICAGETITCAVVAVVIAIDNWWDSLFD